MDQQIGDCLYIDSTTGETYVGLPRYYVGFDFIVIYTLISIIPALFGVALYLSFN